MDDALYTQNFHNAFAGLQFTPTARLEIFANTSWNSAASSISDFTLDAGELTPLLTGLDYPLMAAAFSGFSDIKTRQFVQNAGFNLRLTNEVILYSVLEYNDYNDVSPYLFDATGKYLTFGAGLNWVF